jgi:serine protease Do
MSRSPATPSTRSRWFQTLLGCAALLPIAAAGISPDELKTIDQKVREVVRASLPCTVALIPAGPGREFGTGSGVIVSEDGLILTAAHVSMRMNEKVTVIFPDGKRAKAKVLGMDYTRDAGMVQITDPGKYPHVPLGESTTLKPNDWCLALGHSGGFEKERTPPVRLGRVIEQDPDGFLMTDSTLIGGDSGGPLFDIEGKLIGIHSNIGYSLSQNNHVPIAVFRDQWDRLKGGDRFGGHEEGGLLTNPDRPVIGAELDDAPDGKGALIREVTPRSPAAKAGLKAGDTILKVAAAAIDNREAFIAEIAKRKPGDDLPLSVKTGETEKEITVKLVAARLLAKDREKAPDDSRPRRTEAEKKTLLADFEQKMRESIATGEMQLSLEDMEIFETAEEFQQFMDTFKKSLNPPDLKALNDLVRPAPEPPPVKPGLHDPDLPVPVSDDFIRAVLDGFRPSVAHAARSTHLVFRGSDWKSLCTVVHPDGYAVTKASEIETRNNQALTVMLAKDRQVPAEIVKTFPKHDLALIRLKDVADLPAITWSVGDAARLPLGALICAAGSGPDAVAIGVVSVQPRSLAAEAGGFLAIGTGPHEKGVLVTMVMPGGAADRAGLKKGDIILRIDDLACDQPETLIGKVKGTDPGTELPLEYLRGDATATVRVKLGDRSDLESHLGDPNAKMNRMGTEVSARRTGYQQALQTDLPIRPEECGGPVVDLAGNVIALTIARAGRIATYALPAEDVRQLLEPELKKMTEKQPAAAKKAAAESAN